MCACVCVRDHSAQTVTAAGVWRSISQLHLLSSSSSRSSPHVRRGASPCVHWSQVRDVPRGAVHDHVLRRVDCRHDAGGPARRTPRSRRPQVHAVADSVIRVSCVHRVVAVSSVFAPAAVGVVRLRGLGIRASSSPCTDTITIGEPAVSVALNWRSRERRQSPLIPMQPLCRGDSAAVCHRIVPKHRLRDATPSTRHCPLHGAVVALHDAIATRTMSAPERLDDVPPSAHGLDVCRPERRTVVC